MNWVRVTHRWTSVAFTLAFVANIVAMSTSEGEPPAWVTYSPLLPLGVLFLTGLYLFVLPYTRKRRQEAPSA